MTQAPRGSEEETNPSVGSIGAQIRELRETAGLTLAQLGSRAGVSQGLISQIERGQGNPAYLTLIKIAQALGVPVGAFFAAPETEARYGIVRANERRRLQITDKGLVYELLNPSLTGQLFNVIAHVPPGYSNETAPFRHPGAEESLLVVQGRFYVQVGQQGYSLETGDSVTYQADQTHWFRNPGDTEAVVFATMTPPVF